MTNASGKAVKYASSDVDPKLLALLAAAIAVFVMLSPLILRLVYPDALHRAVIVGRISEVPAPRLQVDPAQDLAALRLAEDERLSSYGWVRREQKTVHMPIERAIDATLERGLPGWRRQ
jgi:hypothetical protein